MGLHVSHFTGNMQRSKSKPQDSSALFSLQELMRLEAERELEERLGEERRAEAEQRARETEEQRQQDEEKRRLAAEEERRMLVARREREEQARLQAIRDAERERARVAAEHVAELEALRSRQDHEQALAVLGRDRSKRRAKWIAVLSVSLLVLVGTGGGLVLRAQMQRTAELEDRIAALSAEIDAKTREISTTMSPDERKRREEELDELRRRIDVLQRGKVTPPPPPRVPPPNVARPVKKDDVCEQIRNNPNDPRRFDPANGCL